MRARNPWRPLALTAIGLLPFKWLSPLTGISHEAILSDVLFSAALPCWLIARRRQLVRLRPSPLHLALGAFVVLALASTVANYDRPGARPADFLLVVELVAIAFLTWDLAQSDSTRRLLAAIVAVDAFATLALALVGLWLFYAAMTRRSSVHMATSRRPATTRGSPRGFSLGRSWAAGASSRWRS